MSMSAADIYARCLLPLKEGYPLYCPELPDRLNVGGYYESYRKKGISIGDIGIITADGDFDYLFNICESRSDSEVNSPTSTNGQAVIESSEFPIGSAGAIGALGQPDTNSDSNPLSPISVTASGLREESQVSHYIEQQARVTSPTVPTGFVSVDPGEIKVRRNYIHPTLPYRSCGMEEQTRFSLEAGMNAIV
jgi:hypothetical protein